MVNPGESTAFPPALRGLLGPAAYPHPVATIELVETHVSWVLLTGSYAYKIKRPVRYPFTDQSSAERRSFLCSEELRLNRRFAPELYLDVCDVRQRDGAAFMGGSGQLLEQAVRMLQFERRQELDRLVGEKALAAGELRAFGRSLARIHAGLPLAPSASEWGRPENVRALLLRNLAEYRLALGQQRSEYTGISALQSSVDALAHTLAPWMSSRREGGHVRECHGDLHTCNVVRHGGELLAFDSLEFEPEFRWIDVAQEVAFLNADLRARGAPEQAQQFLDGYLVESGDFGILRFLDLYRAHGALVRAKVAALDASLGAMLEAYLGAAHSALTSRRKMLVLMCGLSGSGKTWIAAQLAMLLDGIHLRSDIERKRLAGIGERESSRAGVGEGIYKAEDSVRLYAHLARAAGAALGGGQSVVVDASFGQRTDRADFRQLAMELGVECSVVYCHAPPEILRTRIAARQVQGTDASEADFAVLAWQQQRFDPPTAEEGLAVIDVDNSVDTQGLPERIARGCGVSSRVKLPGASC